MEIGAHVSDTGAVNGGGEGAHEGQEGDGDGGKDAAREWEVARIAWVARIEPVSRVRDGRCCCCLSRRNADIVRHGGEFIAVADLSILGVHKHI